MSEKVKSISAVLALAMTIGGLAIAGVSTITSINDLVQQVDENHEQLVTFEREVAEARRDHAQAITQLSEAVRVRADRDAEIVTQLRIAVASVESSAMQPRAESARSRNTARTALDRVEHLSGLEDPLAGLEGL